MTNHDSRTIYIFSTHFEYVFVLDPIGDQLLAKEIHDEIVVGRREDKAIPGNNAEVAFTSIHAALRERANYLIRKADGTALPDNVHFTKNECHRRSCTRLLPS